MTTQSTARKTQRNNKIIHKETLTYIRNKYTAEKSAKAVAALYLFLRFWFFRIIDFFSVNFSRDWINLLSRTTSLNVFVWQLLSHNKHE